MKCVVPFILFFGLEWRRQDVQSNQFNEQLTWLLHMHLVAKHTVARISIHLHLKNQTMTQPNLIVIQFHSIESQNVLNDSIYY